MQNFQRKPKKVNPNLEGLQEFRVMQPTPLLVFLRAKMPKISRNNVKSVLKHKQVGVNGAPVTQFDFMLAPGDIVMVMRHRIPERKNPTPNILFEDEDFLVIDKPSGLLTIASDKEKNETAYRLMMDYMQHKNPHARLYIVHRIDRDTSGVLMFTKKEDLKNIMQAKWNDIVTKRGYYALVEGVPKEKKKTIKSWLHQTSTQLMYSRDHDDDEGQEAITHYEVIKDMKEFSFLDVKIDTGRKNQIRVHLKELGHTVVGDEKYHAEKNPIARLGLHAYALEFTHPLTQKKFRFYAELPQLIKNFVSPKIDKTTSKKV
jgi:23S rRNA pseudouridine1911/1915/1917 synthase